MAEDADGRQVPAHAVLKNRRVVMYRVTAGVAIPTEVDDENYRVSRSPSPWVLHRPYTRPPLTTSRGTP